MTLPTQEELFASLEPQSLPSEGDVLAPPTQEAPIVQEAVGEVLPAEADVFSALPAGGAEEPSLLRQLWFGAASAETDFNYGMDIARSKWRFGEFDITEMKWYSGTELYGEDFPDLTDEEARVRINERDDQRIRNEFGDIYEAGLENSAASTTGAFAGILATPTTLIPFGATGSVVKIAAKAAVMGGGLGAEYSILQQLAEEGEVDPTTVLAHTAMGVVIAPIPVVGGKLLGAKIQLRNNSNVPAQMGNKGARRMWNQIQAEQRELLNMPVDELPPLVSKAASREEGIVQEMTRRYPEVAEDLATFEKKAGAKMPIADNTDAKRWDAYNNGGPGGLITHTLDQWVGITSTRIKNLSEAVFGDVRHTDFRVHDRTAAVSRGVELLDKSVAKADKAVGDDIYSLLQDGKWDEVIANRARYGDELVDNVEGMRHNIQTMGKELYDTGAISKESFEELEHTFFPRFVKDVKGIKEARGGEFKEAIQAAITKEAKKLKRDPKLKNPLTHYEEAMVINKFFRVRSSSGATKAEKKRVYETIPDDLKEFYFSPREALHMYARGAIDEIETRKFFGYKHKAIADKFDDGNLIEKGTRDTFNIEDSVGATLRKEEERLGRKLTDAQATEMQSLLTSRFGVGRVQTAHNLNAVKEAAYMAMLANPHAAMTQFGDVGMSFVVNGVSDTVSTMVERLGGRALTNVAKSKGLVKGQGKAPHMRTDVHLGVSDVSAEMSQSGATAKWFHRFMKASGFQGADRFGKNTFINAATKKASKIYKADGTIHTENFNALYNKYTGAWGGEKTGKLMSDLKKFKKTGELTEEIREFAFNELADVQPISRSEVPQKFLDMPNGKWVYMLQSYTLKVLDVTRNRVINKMKNGIQQKDGKLVGEAVKDAARIALYLGSMNAGVTNIKKYMSGKEVYWDEFVLQDMPEALGQLFLFSKYEVSRARGPSDWLGKKVSASPLPGAVDVAARAGKAAWEGDFEKLGKEGNRAAGWIPFAGRGIRDYGLGGTDDYNKKKKEERQKKALPSFGVQDPILGFNKAGGWGGSRLGRGGN